MGLGQQLRQLQDAARNHGWRIQWIPWQGEGRVERVYNSRLSGIMVLLGLLMFLGPIIGGAATIYSPGLREWVKGLDPQPVHGVVVGGVAVGGIVLLLLSRLVAARARQAGWVAVDARCIDREVAACLQRYGDAGADWTYRLLCRFEHGGREYTVTPEASELVAFRSEEAVRAYLDETISPEGRCRLWIDPENPLHAVFHRKQRMA